MANYNQLKTRAQQVRDEQTIGGNTALRVGQLLMDMVDAESETVDNIVELFTGTEDNPVIPTLPNPGLLHWLQSPIVALVSMGEDLDGDAGAVVQEGDLYYYNHSGYQIFVKGSGSLPGTGYKARQKVLYLNKYTGKLYEWTGSFMSEITIPGSGGGGGGGGDGGDITVDSALSLSSNNPVKNKVITAALAGKQDTISDLATIRTGARKGATAIQSSDLATVATSGSYNDLINKPTILSQSDVQDMIDDAVDGISGGVSKVKIGSTEYSPNINGVVDISSGVSAAQPTIDPNTGNWIVNGQVTQYPSQGAQGNSGYTGAANELEVVNNLTDGGATKALSAEMGIVLRQNITSVYNSLDRLYSKLANMAFWDSHDQDDAEPTALNFNIPQKMLTISTNAVGAGVIVKINNASFTSPMNVDAGSQHTITIEADDNYILNNDVAITIGGASQTLTESGGVYSLQITVNDNMSIAITATATQDWYTAPKDDVSESGNVVKYGMQQGRSINGTYGFLTDGSGSSTPLVIASPAGIPLATKIFTGGIVYTDGSGSYTNTNPGKTTASYFATGGKRYLNVKLIDTGTLTGYVHKVAVGCYSSAVINNTQGNGVSNNTKIDGNKGRINYAEPNVSTGDDTLQWKIDLSAQASGIEYVKILMCKYPTGSSTGIDSRTWYNDLTLKYKFTDD